MIEDKAKELGRLIGQSTEYQAVKRASDALNEDKDTVALLQKMEQLRVDAQRMMQRGERPTEEMEKQLDALLGQIQGRAAYQRLLVAQENFDKIMGARERLDSRGHREGRDELDHHARLVDDGRAAGSSCSRGRKARARPRSFGCSPTGSAQRGHIVVAVREPGGTVVGDEIRASCSTRSRTSCRARRRCCSWRRARSSSSARFVRRSTRGDSCSSTGFFSSTYAYQGVGRGLPEEELRGANRIATAGLVPDLTLLLTLPAEEGLARARGAARRPHGARRSWLPRARGAGVRDVSRPGVAGRASGVRPGRAGRRRRQRERRVRARAGDASTRWPESFPSSWFRVARSSYPG